MNITNDRPVMVFKNKNKYIVGVSKKKQNGEYENAYIKIEFNKDIELEDKTLIKIKNAWLSFYNWEYENKKGTTFFIKCNEFEIIENNELENLHTKTENDTSMQIKITDEDLPF